MHLASDKWMRLTTPNGDANTFAGSGDIGGFAGLNIHAHNNITAKNTTNAGHLKVTRGSDFTALTAAQGGGENHGLGNHFFQDWIRRDRNKRGHISTRSGGGAQRTCEKCRPCHGTHGGVTLTPT